MFKSLSNGSIWTAGTLHDTYTALETGCLYTPSSCSYYFSTNSNRVYNFFVSRIVPLVR